MQDSKEAGVLPPVMCQVMFVRAFSKDGDYSLTLGAVFDSYATDNYITYKHAKKLGLEHSLPLSFLLPEIGLKIGIFCKKITDFFVF